MLNRVSIIVLSIFIFQFANVIAMEKTTDLYEISSNSGDPSNKIKFTYLDVIDSTIAFEPVYYTNTVTRPLNDKESISYPIYTHPSHIQPKLPGYYGKRCIIDIESAIQLSSIQTELVVMGYKLKVLDAYRPQSTVELKTLWKQTPEDPIFKKYHHPRVAKSDLQRLSYVAARSGHTRGVAVDVTIIDESRGVSVPPEDFLGIWDYRELDMGNVGFLAFDPRSGHDYSELTEKQVSNRKLLVSLMEGNGYQKLRSEFWHYFYKRERNTDTYYDFPVVDDYLVREDKTLVLPEKRLFVF